MSDAVRPSGEAPHGTSLLPADLTDDQFDAAPVLDAIDDLVIEELSEDEDDAFAEPVHANDLWMATSAVHIDAPLLTGDAVFEDVPGLSLHR